MRYKEHTYGKMWLAGLLMVLSSLFTACTNDLQEEDMESGNRLGMVSFTRGDNPFTVTEDYSPVGVFLVDEDANVETQSGRFVYKTNETPAIWRSSIEVTSNHHYAIYGYSPANAVTATISNETVSGATLTFSNLPAVSSQDVCFVVGVQQLTAKSDEKNIPLGQFAFTGKALNENFVNLLMDHVYAGLKLQMTIDSEYAQLRKIKIRKLELKTAHSTVSTTVMLEANDTGTSPVNSVTYGTATGTAYTSIFFENTEGQELDAQELTEATCCFVPTLSEDLTLVTTYDVYDRYDNKIGERTATNKLPNLIASRGQRVTLRLNIMPTYLYVLSDPDLDNPTVVVQ